MSTKVIRKEKQNEYWSNRALTYGHQYGLDRLTVQYKIKRKVELMASIIDFSVKDIIEFGCGTGLYTKEFAGLNENLLSTDISFEMIEVAKQYCPEVKFEQMDVRKLSLLDCSYNVVLSAFLLQHVEIKLVLPEMYRILRPNGYMGAFVPNILNPLHYSRARVGFMRKILHENSESDDYDRWQWVNILKHYNFTPVCVLPIEFTSPYLPLRLLSMGEVVSEVMESTPLIREFAGTLLIVAKK